MKIILTKEDELIECHRVVANFISGQKKEGNLYDFNNLDDMEVKLLIETYIETENEKKGGK